MLEKTQRGMSLDTTRGCNLHGSQHHPKTAAQLDPTEWIPRRLFKRIRREAYNSGQSVACHSGTLESTCMLVTDVSHRAAAKV